MENNSSNNTELKIIPFSKKSGELFNREYINLYKEIKMEKEKLELQKLKMEIDEIRRGKLIHSFIEKLLYAGLLIIIGIFGNVWIESMKSDSAIEIEKIREYQQKKIIEINESYQNERQRQSEYFQSRLLLQNQDFKKNLEARREIFKLYKSEINESIEKNREESRRIFELYLNQVESSNEHLKSYLEAELKANSNLLNKALEQSKIIRVKRTEFYNILARYLLDIQDMLQKDNILNQDSLKVINIKIHDIEKANILFINEDIIDEIEGIFHKPLKVGNTL